MNPTVSALLRIHVQPRASRTEVVGWHGDAIKIRVKAPPVDGAANTELIQFLAKRLGVQRRDVTIRSGTTSRTKRIAIAGHTASEVTATLLGEGQD